MESRLFAGRQAADEARHVRFGTDYLTDWFRHHTRVQLAYYGQFLVDQALKLASSDNLSVAIGMMNNKLEQRLQRFSGR